MKDRLQKSKQQVNLVLEREREGQDTTARTGVPASLPSATATSPTRNTVTTAALTPKAAKDFSDPNYGDQ